MPFQNAFAAVSEFPHGETPALLGAIIGVVVVIVLVVLALVVLIIVAQWKIFKKAGVPGWVALVPYYSLTKTLEIGKKPMWWSFMILIPIVNIFFCVKIVRRLAAVFGKGAWFTVGMIFLPFIFLPIIAFGKSQYNPAVVSDDRVPLSEAGKYALITAALGTLLGAAYVAPTGGAFGGLSIIASPSDEGSGYATDGRHVYLYDRLILGASASTFEITGDYYAKDLFSVYYQGQKVKGADADTFTEFSNGYAKDAARVYYAGDPMPGADAATFVMLDNATDSQDAEDKDHVYSYGQIVH